MTIVSKIDVFLLIKRGALFFSLLLISCDPQLSDDPIPFLPFSDVQVIVANHIALSSNGGSILVNDGGVRGIILYRKDASTFLAFERNCSFHPNDACATVEIHASTLYMQDACCGSSFNFEGNPTGGPAWRPLNQYETFFSAGTVTITDQLAN